MEEPIVIGTVPRLGHTLTFSDLVLLEFAHVFTHTHASGAVASVYVRFVLDYLGRGPPGTHFSRGMGDSLNP